ncbi:MAG: M12 family metallo-peptidase [Planctomycetota bacterium]
MRRATCGCALICLTSGAWSQSALTTDVPTATTIAVDGVDRAVELEPIVLRADDFRVVIEGVSGSRTVSGVPATTVRGVTPADPGTRLTGSLIGGELTGVLTTSDGRVLEIEHVGGENIALVIDPELLDDMACGNPVWHADTGGEGHEGHQGHEGHDHAEAFVGAEPIVGLLTEPSELTGLVPGFIAAAAFNAPPFDGVARLAVDVDYPLFEQFGLDVNATVAAVESLIAGVSDVYGRSFGLRYELVEIRIYESPGAEPYVGTDSIALLSQARSTFDARRGEVDFDFGHLLSGRVFDGGIAGRASQDSACGDSPYGISQWLTGANRRIGLVTHELGHNWGAQHCNGSGDCRVMCATIGACDGLSSPIEFGATVRAAIASNVVHSTCVGDDPITAPGDIGLGDALLDDTVWAGARDFFPAVGPGGVQTGIIVAPSGGLRTLELDTSALPDEHVAVEVSPIGLPALSPDDRLVIEVGVNAEWLPIATLSPDRPGLFERTVVQVPAEARAFRAPLRVRAEGMTAWEVRGVGIGVPFDEEVYTLPLVESFEFGALALNRWMPGQLPPSGSLPVPAFRGEAAQKIGTGTGLITVPLESTAPAGHLEVRFAANGLRATSPLQVFSTPADTPAARLALASIDGTPDWKRERVLLPLPASGEPVSVGFNPDQPMGFGLIRVGDWYIDEVSITPRRGTCDLDLAAPFGVISVADLYAFIDIFTASEGDEVTRSIVDIAAPFGVVSTTDLFKFIDLYTTGTQCGDRLAPAP